VRAALRGVAQALRWPCGIALRCRLARRRAPGAPPAASRDPPRRVRTWTGCARIVRGCRVGGRVEEGDDVHRRSVLSSRFAGVAHSWDCGLPVFGTSAATAPRTLPPAPASNGCRFKIVEVDRVVAGAGYDREPRSGRLDEAQMHILRQLRCVDVAAASHRSRTSLRRESAVRAQRKHLMINGSRSTSA